MIAKIKLRQLISASLILVSTAHLQAADSENQSTDSSVFVDAYYDLYLTGAIGFATTDVSKSDMNDRFADKGFDASTDSVDGDRFGWNVGIGYDITERWSVELAYYDLGDVDVVFQATPVVESVADIYPESGHGWAIAGKYRHPITEKIDLTGKLGLFSWDADYDTEFTATGARVGDDDDSGNDLFYGVGADYHYNDKWTLTAQLQRFEFDRDATHFLSVGFEYRWSKARTSVLESERPMTLAEQPAVETTSQPTALAAAPLVVAAPLDSDNDGIVDQADRCPDTAEGTMVNEVGCTVLEVQNLRFELDVKFATASDEIDPTHTGSLNEMTELMKQHPEVIVVIEGHTDSRGAASYNQNLSDKRAKSVVRYLVEEGSIDKSRLSAVGYGESKPVASNATAEGRKENRRVIAVVNIQKTADPLK